LFTDGGEVVCFTGSAKAKANCADNFSFFAKVDGDAMLACLDHVCVVYGYKQLVV
jgi:hypothetical protein